MDGAALEVEEAERFGKIAGNGSQLLSSHGHAVRAERTALQLEGDGGVAAPLKPLDELHNTNLVTGVVAVDGVENVAFKVRIALKAVLKKLDGNTLVGLNVEAFENAGEVAGTALGDDLVLAGEEGADGGVGVGSGGGVVVGVHRCWDWIEWWWWWWWWLAIRGKVLVK